MAKTAEEIQAEIAILEARRQRKLNRIELNKQTINAAKSKITQLTADITDIDAQIAVLQAELDAIENPEPPEPEFGTFQTPKNPTIIGEDSITFNIGSGVPLNAHILFQQLLSGSIVIGPSFTFSGLQGISISTEWMQPGEGEIEAVIQDTSTNPWWFLASVKAPVTAQAGVVEPPVEPPLPTGYWEQTAKARSNGLGVNLGEYDPWGTGWPFSNLVEQAQLRSPDWTQYYNEGDFATKEVLVAIGHDLATLFPGTQWEFVNSGTASLKNTFPTSKTNEGLQPRIGPGTLGSDFGVYVKGESRDTFRKVFLDRLAPVAGYIRYMDWNDTNNSTRKNWIDEPTGKFYAKNGVPLKVMIELCNTIGAYPWFCFSHQATDDYIRKYCQYVKANLDPRLVAIFELSNEVWNTQFQQHNYFKGSGDYTAALVNYANRARQVMNIVKQEIPNSYRILGSQENNVWVSDVELSGDCSMFTHLATGWYFGYWMDQSSSTPTDPAEIVQKCVEDIPRLVANLNQHKSKAAAKGLKLCGYEGLQHLVGVGSFVDTYYARFKSAVRHPNMGPAESQLRAAVKPLFDFGCAYTFDGRDNKYGLWGLLPYIEADLSVSYRYNSMVADAQA